MLLIGVECVIFAHVFECFFSFRRAWSGFAIVAVAVCTVKEKHFRLFIQVIIFWLCSITVGGAFIRLFQLVVL